MSEEAKRVVAETPCPECGEKMLRLETRPKMVAKPLGSYSLSGQTTKVSVIRVQWPWLVCDNVDCEFEEQAKL